MHLLSYFVMKTTCKENCMDFLRVIYIKKVSLWDDKCDNYRAHIPQIMFPCLKYVTEQRCVWCSKTDKPET